MINMNQEMFDLITRSHFDGSTSHILWLMDGVYPGAEALNLAERNSSNLWYEADHIKDVCEAAGCTLRGYILFEDGLDDQRINRDTHAFALGNSTRELVQVESGNVTWFMYFRTNGSGVTDAVAVGGTFDPSQIFVGSIGDIGSGKDIEVPNAALDPLKDYKATDLIFTVSQA